MWYRSAGRYMVPCNKVLCWLQTAHSKNSIWFITDMYDMMWWCDLFSMCWLYVRRPSCVRLVEFVFWWSICCTLFNFIIILLGRNYFRCRLTLTWIIFVNLKSGTLTTDDFNSFIYFVRASCNETDFELLIWFRLVLCDYRTLNGLILFDLFWSTGSILIFIHWYYLIRFVNLFD